MFIPAAPSAPPSSVRVSVESSTAISVQWGPVEPCADQNGPITGYSVRYGEMGSGSTQNKAVSGDSRMTTISELTKETVYTVEVAAETRAGTGVYSLPLTIQTPDSEWFQLYIVPNYSALLLTYVCGVSYSPSNSNSTSSSLLFLRLQFLFICTSYINCDGIDTQCFQLPLLLPCFSLQALVVRCAPLRSLTAAAVMCTCSNHPL